MNRRDFLLGTTAATVGLLAPPPVQATALSRSSEFIGVWISPDWYFPGEKVYSENQVRQQARRVLSSLANSGVSDVFFESFLRGQSVCPAVQLEGRSVRLGGESLKTYPHLRWSFRTEYDSVVDSLEIWISEAKTFGIYVHAWVHACYWTQDVPEVMLDWHEHPSEWSQLFAEYLQEQADSNSKVQDLAQAAAKLFTSTTCGERLRELLRQKGVSVSAGPMAALIGHLVEQGSPAPDFLLLGPADDLFPHGRGSHLRPIFVDPSHPKVRQVLLKVVRNLWKGHPNLAGIHLDHIRYPVDGQGLPPKLAVRDGTYRFFDQINPSDLSRFGQLQETLNKRKTALQELVSQVRQEVPTNFRLSAAVLPAYYRERDNGRFRLCGYDYSAQDWVGWPVDFVVPMLYEMSPNTIRNLVELMSYEQDSRLGRQKIVVYPGVSQQWVGRKGDLESPGWVFFDLKQARDVKLRRKEASEVLNFEPQ